MLHSQFVCTEIYFLANLFTYVAFIDFTKAFDYVVRDNLWLKLIKFGVRGKILNVIQSMYGSVKSMVKYNNSLSDDFECYLGVRQGECLSPFLFSMYLNDIEETFIRGKFQGVEIGMLKLFLCYCMLMTLLFLLIMKICYKKVWKLCMIILLVGN